MSKRVLITIGGGSASGKTYLVNKILNALQGQEVTVISHDEYYKDQSELTMSERLLTNYDHPSSLDNDLLCAHIESLLSGQSIIKPKYDFIMHTRSKETEQVHPHAIIILEGILSLEDPRIRELTDISLFIKCDDDTRFIRRLLRDTNERGRSTSSVISQYTKTVKPMFHAFVKPTMRHADFVIPNDDKCDVAVDVLVTVIAQKIREFNR